ncbi:MAG: hypothetical protein ABIQ01_11260 [Pseudolysinimonas sp.]
MNLSRLATEPDSLAWLGPVVLTSGSIIVALLGTIGLIWRRRQDRHDAVADQKVSKQASESDEWDEVRVARAEATKYYNLYVFFRNLFYDVQAALKHLVRKLRDAHPDMELDQDAVDALALKPDADAK